MGGGASADHGLNISAQQFFCHQCRRAFQLSNREVIQCNFCQSAFVEEINNSMPHNAVTLAENGQINVEQQRRMLNAATMLRLLESQLRDEFAQLNYVFESINMGGNRFRLNEVEAEKMKKFTNIMKFKCRRIHINLDQLCSQPSCPICSEDFAQESEVFRLPCSHFFHEGCVVPWLELKQNCPICRSEQSNELLSVEEYAKYSHKELLACLEELKVEISDPDEKNSSDLAFLLHKHLKEQQQEQSRAEFDRNAQELARQQEIDRELRHRRDRYFQSLVPEDTDSVQSDTLQHNPNQPFTWSRYRSEYNHSTDANIDHENDHTVEDTTTTNNNNTINSTLNAFLNSVRSGNNSNNSNNSVNNASRNSNNNSSSHLSHGNSYNTNNTNNSNGSGGGGSGGGSGNNLLTAESQGMSRAEFLRLRNERNNTNMRSNGNTNADGNTTTTAQNTDEVIDALNNSNSISGNRNSRNNNIDNINGYSNTNNMYSNYASYLTQQRAIDEERDRILTRQLGNTGTGSGSPTGSGPNRNRFHYDDIHTDVNDVGSDRAIRDAYRRLSTGYANSNNSNIGNSSNNNNNRNNMLYDATADDVINMPSYSEFMNSVVGNSSANSNNSGINSGGDHIHRMRPHRRSDSHNSNYTLNNNNSAHNPSSNYTLNNSSSGLSHRMHDHTALGRMILSPEEYNSSGANSGSLAYSSQDLANAHLYSAIRHNPALFHVSGSNWSDHDSDDESGDSSESRDLGSRNASLRDLELLREYHSLLGNQREREREAAEIIRQREANRGDHHARSSEIGRGNSSSVVNRGSGNNDNSSSSHGGRSSSALPTPNTTAVDLSDANYSDYRSRRNAIMVNNGHRTVDNEGKEGEGKENDNSVTTTDNAYNDRNTTSTETIEEGKISEHK